MAQTDITSELDVNQTRVRHKGTAKREETDQQEN
jgi:hypothetical protein